MTRKDGTPRTTPDLSALFRAEVAQMEAEQTDADWIGYSERNDAA